MRVVIPLLRTIAFAFICKKIKITPCRGRPKRTDDSFYRIIYKERKNSRTCFLPGKESNRRPVPG